MDAIKLGGGRLAPMTPPPKLDQISLIQAWMAHRAKPAALNRLKLATIGLCWWASVDALPNRTQADKAERLGITPPFPRLEDCDCDLLKLGAAVGGALADEDVQELFRLGDLLAAELFASLFPSDKDREDARGNSGGRQAPPSEPISD